MEAKKTPQQLLEQVEPREIFNIPDFKEKFISTQVLSCRKTVEDATQFEARTAIYFRQAMTADPKLLNCTKMSILSCYLDVALEDIDLAPGQKSEAYLSSRGVNTGTKAAPIYKDFMKVVMTAWGELARYIRNGVIKRAANPIVVYDGDAFGMGLNENGDMMIRYEAKFPRNEKAKIIACFVKILLPDGGYDFKVIDQLEIDRLAGYSKKNNRGTSANDLYTSNNGQIDPGFLMTKTIKHALKGYSKVAFKAENVEHEDEATQEQREFFPAKSDADPQAPSEELQNKPQGECCAPDPGAPETPAAKNDDDIF
ncbi:MAG: hypothetical protein A2W93_14475 [Bacteroidetes bacterium GWF2_43_63]|nr:MAG: hypothetical protein A2W94_01045 [Bacteroidetes bacterium GWE2_42_42]OFY52546.1 MAG: hypothetical protein A2W93_14475 [Bacteroidetes bacterium GWF2_43_63]HBG71454.1 hypothetical protein [Bacteroidales bacterium]HCB60794.1 hypothetical protein [Bacteroidales bacterium]HCY23481.1 hypothetical protein [Bacteroidales bacterium]